MTFDVEYTIKTQDSAEGQVVKDLGIKSDRIRLLAAADGTLPGYVKPDAPPVHVVNEYTGESNLLYFLSYIYFSPCFLFCSCQYLNASAPHYYCSTLFNALLVTVLQASACGRQ